MLAVVKQGLGCYFERLQELANLHLALLRMLWHRDWMERQDRFHRQTLIDNESLLSPRYLARVGELVLKAAMR